MKHLPRIVQVLFVTGFCVSIAIPLLAGSWSSGSVLLAENRKSAPFPKMSLIAQDTRGFFRSVETYVNDHSGMRQRLVEWHNIHKYFVLGVSSSQDVLVGKNGWLYWAMKDDGDVIAHYRGLKTLTPAQLTDMARSLQERNDWLSSRGVTYVHFVVPNKHTIYPEFLPDSVTRITEESHMDRFMNYAKEHTTLCIVDPRLRLWEAKKDYLTYHRTDTHWNAYGAYVAYLELVDVLRKRFPEVRPRSLSSGGFRQIPGAWKYVTPSITCISPLGRQNHEPLAGDLAGMLGLQRILSDVSVVPDASQEFHARVVPTPYRPFGWESTKDGPDSSLGHAGLLTTECDGKPLKVLVIHDSCGPLLIPYISETFNRVTYVWDEAFEFARGFAENGDVDVAIHVHVERHLLPDYLY